MVDFLNRASQAGLTWLLPEAMDERDLDRPLFPTQPSAGQHQFAKPDISNVYLVLKNKTVTKQIMSQEYRQRHPKDGYSYAQFYHRFREWLGQ